MGLNETDRISLGYSLNVGLMMNTLVGASQSTPVGINQTTNVGENITLKAGQSITLKVGASVLVQESDSAHCEPRCDVLLAHATGYAPEGKPAPRRPVGVKVGDWHRLWLTLGITLLLTACFSGNGLGNSFMSFSYPAKKFFKGHYLLMAQAIERNDMEQLKQLAQGQDLSLKGDKDMDLMWFAIARENFDAIRTLVELGVNPDEMTAEGIGSALQYTFMKHDDTRFLRAMLDGGLSPNHRHPRQKLMLQRGVFGGLEHVKLLLERGTHIDDTDSIGGTALHTATTSVEPDTAIFLIDQGADFKTHKTNGSSVSWSVYLSVQDMRPGNPIHTKYLELRDLMIEKGAKWPPDSPIEVRDQMRARGENPPVPPGQPR